MSAAAAAAAAAALAVNDIKKERKDFRLFRG